MPRIYTSQSDPIDYCKYHFKRYYPTEEKAFAKWGNVGDGPDGRGNCFSYDDDHPAYEYDDYRCYVCRKRLDETDS